MTLDQFVSQVHADVESFRQMWRNEQDDEENLLSDWPDEMDPGDWGEQFFAFLTSECE